jgi:hypothetical protein
MTVRVITSNAGYHLLFFILKLLFWGRANCPTRSDLLKKRPALSLPFKTQIAQAHHLPDQEWEVA